MKNRRRTTPGQRSGGVSAPFPLEQRLGTAFAAVDQRAGVIEEWIDAIADVVGRDKVKAAFDQRRTEKADAAFKSAVDSGQVVPADQVAETSLVCGVEARPRRSRSAAIRARVRLTMAQIVPEVRAQLLGRRVGDSIKMPAGTKFTIDSIYEVKCP